MPESPLHHLVSTWYAASARDLPWRRPGSSPWAVLVSEVMLQQTPVDRVLPVYEAWVHRWPTPTALAGDSVGAAVRLWGRLGYPRRARRLWQAAHAIDRTFDGVVPADYDDLRSLPGVGDYTAAAVAAFAFSQRTVVLDTNVRRVLSRLLAGREKAPATLTKTERAAAERLVPEAGAQAAVWSVALMELGALVCTARSPDCSACPVSQLCLWRQRGYPRDAGPVRRRTQHYEGTDRQCRGRILSLLRDSDGPVTREAVVLTWAEAAQRERALSSLVCDGLVVEVGDATIALP